MALKQVLTIAGSDSGGGAGIQADIKAMSANGVFAMSVITAITAQNTEEVTEVFELPASIIAAQIDAVFDDFEVAAVKTGMLASAEIVKIVAKMLRPQKVANLDVDPVMVSKSGHPLLKPDAIEEVIKQLIPLSSSLHRTSTKPSRSPASGSKTWPTPPRPQRSSTRWAGATSSSKAGHCPPIRGPACL